MADALASAVAGIAKTRITGDERALLADNVNAARQLAHASPPAQLAPVEIYVEPEWVLAARVALPAPEFRLYRRDGGHLHYRWAWFDQKAGVVVAISGLCGQRDEVTRYPGRDLGAARELIGRFESKARTDGYKPVSASRMVNLVVIWRLPDTHPRGALDRRHAIEEFLDAETCWLGLGYCDGGDIGSGEMTVFCFVVNFPVAKVALAQALSAAGYGDFAEIRHQK